MSIFQVMCDKDLIRFLQNRTSCSRFPESQCTIFSPLWRQQQRCSPVRLRILWSADLCLFDKKKEIYRENKWNDAWLNNRTNLPLSSTDIGFSTTTVWLWEWGIDWRNTTNTNSTISITSYYHQRALIWEYTMLELTAEVEGTIPELTAILGLWTGIGTLTLPICKNIPKRHLRYIQRHIDRQRDLKSERQKHRHITYQNNTSRIHKNVIKCILQKELRGTGLFAGPRKK